MPKIKNENFMYNNTDSEKIKEKIESKREKKEKYEKKLTQLKNQEKQITGESAVDEDMTVYAIYTPNSAPKEESKEEPKEESSKEPREAPKEESTPAKPKHPVEASASQPHHVLAQTGVSIEMTAAVMMLSVWAGLCIVWKRWFDVSG